MRDGEFPLLTTERLILTIPDPTFAPQLTAFFAENREHLGRWSPPEPPADEALEYYRKRLVTAREDFARGAGARFLIFRREDPEQAVIGTSCLSQIVRGPFQACYLGYEIAERFEGQGLMFEAVTAVIQFAFHELRLHRIMANYMPTNERSGRLLRRLGFVPEGYARDYLYINGKWRDHVLTSLTNHELAMR